MGALNAPNADTPETVALRLLLAASALRDDQTRIPLRWCRRLHALGISDGFVSGLQVMSPNWIKPPQQRILTDALLAADTDTAATSRVGGAILRQDGHAFLLSDPDRSNPSRTIPSYVRAALNSLPKQDRTGLCDPRLSAHERLARSEALHLSLLRPAPHPGPGLQRLLYIRMQGHILLLEDRPDSRLPRVLSIHH